MRYSYFSLYYLRGVSLSQEEEILSDASSGVRSILTLDAASFIGHLDTATVLPAILCTAKVGDDPEMDARLAEAIRALREERARKLKGACSCTSRQAGKWRSFLPMFSATAKASLSLWTACPSTIPQDT